MKKVLVLTHAALPAKGRLTLGSGARQYEMARALARAGLDVTLLAPSSGDAIENVTTREFAGEAALPAGFDAYVLPTGFFGAKAERPRESLVVADAYDLSLFSYASRDAATEEGRVAFESRIHEIASALLEADVILHAGTPARHALLGMLALLGRIAPGHADPSDDLLDVPLGGAPMPACGPLVTDPPLPPGAEVVLWPSGTYVFFDADRALAAFELVAARRPAAHLLVVGALGPSPSAADRANFEHFAAAARASRAASRIRFADWLPYPERRAMYAASSVALVLTRPGPEDELSWRNRVIDCLSAGLPVVVDGESELSRTVALEGGICVERTPEAAASALESVLGDPARRAEMSHRARHLAEGPLSWDAVAHPLARRIERGRDPLHLSPVPVGAVTRRRKVWGTTLHRAEVSLRLRGPAGFLAHGLSRAAGRRRDRG